MKARTLRIIALMILIAAVIAVYRLGYASSRCTNSITYTAEIPSQPGREYAYSIPMPDVPGEDQVLACTAFMILSDGALLHFGYDQQSECIDGYCVAGMELGKYLNEMAFMFWWQDPASEPPVEVIVYFRDCWTGEYCGPQTPTPTLVNTATSTPTPNGTPKHDEPRPTPSPTPASVNWLPYVEKHWDIIIGPPADPRVTPEVGR